jgi:hypothetical protein
MQEMPACVHNPNNLFYKRSNTEHWHLRALVKNTLKYEDFKSYN